MSVKEQRGRPIAAVDDDDGEWLIGDGEATRFFRSDAQARRGARLKHEDAEALDRRAPEVEAVVLALPAGLVIDRDLKPATEPARHLIRVVAERAALGQHRRQLLQVAGQFQRFLPAFACEPHLESERRRQHVRRRRCAGDAAEVSNRVRLVRQRRQEKQADGPMEDVRQLAQLFDGRRACVRLPLSEAVGTHADLLGGRLDVEAGPLTRPREGLRIDGGLRGFHGRSRSTSSS